jgi:hypothetical protein
MNTKLVTLQVPVGLYDKLQALALETHTDLIGVITQLVTDTDHRKSWLASLIALRQQIENDGGLSLSHSQVERVTQLRQTRDEIFETEYAHLYRLLNGSMLTI